MSAEVEKEFISVKRTCRPYLARTARTCCAIKSRKEVSSRTVSSDFACCSPIEVPSPPFSLNITNWSSSSSAGSPMTPSSCSPLG